MAEVDKSVYYSTATVKVHTHTDEKATVFNDKKTKAFILKNVSGNNYIICNRSNRFFLTERQPWPLKRTRMQSCKKHTNDGNIRKERTNREYLKKLIYFLPKAQLVPASEDYTVWLGIPQDRGSALQTKIIFTTKYEMKCRLCNDIYLVLRAEVSGVLIGQSEAEVSEDVGEDQEHLKFIDQFHFPSI
jgi:hypothetical protein